MDYARAERADRLAAEYVLGTLRGPARRRFETLLQAHPALRQAVQDWEQRLEPLQRGVVPVEPPAQVWTSLERRLFAGDAERSINAGAAAAPQPPGLWARLGFWRAAAGVSAAAVVVLAAVLVQPPAAQAPIVVVLAPTTQTGPVVEARFVASVSGDGRALLLRPLGAVALEPSRVLELWAVPAAGAPRSLGLVQAGGDTRVLRARLLDDTAAFAVSIEPAGGSPTGAPTGPIVSAGRLGT